MEKFLPEIQKKSIDNKYNPMITEAFYANIEKLEKQYKDSLKQDDKFLINKNRKLLIKELSALSNIEMAGEKAKEIINKLSDLGVKAQIKYTSGLSESGIMKGDATAKIIIPSDIEEIKKNETKVEDNKKIETGKLENKNNETAEADEINKKASQLPPELQQAYIQMTQGENKDFGIKGGSKRKTGLEAVINAMEEGAINAGMTGLNKGYTAWKGDQEFMKYILPSAEKIYGTKFTELTPEAKKELEGKMRDRAELENKIIDLKNKTNGKTFDGNLENEKADLSTAEFQKGLLDKNIENLISSSTSNRFAQGTTPQQNNILDYARRQAEIAFEQWRREAPERLENYKKQNNIAYDSQAKLLWIQGEINNQLAKLTATNSPLTALLTGSETTK